MPVTTAKLLVEPYMHADAILLMKYADEWRELQSAITGTPIPLRPAGPYTKEGRPKTPKRQYRKIGKTRAFQLFPIDQKQWNKDLERTLRDTYGWKPQPFAIAQEGLGQLPTLLKGDFHKREIFVEVEFGNTASLHRDLFKFHIAGRSGSGSVGVVVVASDEIARFFDQGVATFEQARSLLPYISIGIQLPILLVGVTLPDMSPVRARYEEMQAVVEAEGETCHGFEVVAKARPEEAVPEEPDDVDD
jgi:hypothetical protein